MNCPNCGANLDTLSEMLKEEPCVKEYQVQGIAGSMITRHRISHAENCNLALMVIEGCETCREHFKEELEQTYARFQSAKGKLGGRPKNPTYAELIAAEEKENEKRRGSVCSTNNLRELKRLAKATGRIS